MAKKNTVSTASLVEGLFSLSKNLWWTWNVNAQAIFNDLSPELWMKSNHNASALLADISSVELRARLGNPEFAANVAGVLNEFNAYMKNKSTWAAKHAKHIKGTIAYFSAEFGFHESVRIYSGGLGILAGDHTKSASDLGIPFVGISLFYREGYFEQRITVDGWQQEQYVPVDYKKQPTEAVLDKDGKLLMCSVRIGFSDVKFIARKLAVGRSIVLLLDTNLTENEERFRDITAHVYGGDSATRISQEIILGMGGVKMLRAMGIKPSTFHMNEGHSGFLTLELLGEEIEKGVPLEKAIDHVKKQCIFTTHTPVPAGHDRFNYDLMKFVFEEKATSHGMTLDELMKFGSEHPDKPHEPFCMTVLCLKMSRTANGVSELHGHVSREMWKMMYPEVKKVDDVPIGSITNGIHINTWSNASTTHFWNKRIGEGWKEKFLDHKFWETAVTKISDEELWAHRYQLRRQLIEFTRRRLHLQHSRYGNGTAVYETILNPDALTIGFARRFATYKRAPLLFTHFENILEIFNDHRHPVQIIFAGKAHPRDDEGKKFIQKIIEYSKHPNLFGKVVFLENYDMNVARHLISGADVWLNNPRRPLEASGTSGQKVAIHGGLNCSIMDGWWREAYDGSNGFSIGGDGQPEAYDVQDRQDADFLYDVIKNTVIPEYYDRDKNGLPVKWLKRVRRAIATLVPQYNTHRMVADYTTKYYK
ncbi:MAG: alpha-glucan family phosphorylase [Bacteroidota bacterium]|jgi:starch phosphorylase